MGIRSRLAALERKSGPEGGGLCCCGGGVDVGVVEGTMLRDGEDFRDALAGAFPSTRASRDGARTDGPSPDRQGPTSHPGAVPEDLLPPLRTCARCLRPMRRLVIKLVDVPSKPLPNLRRGLSGRPPTSAPALPECGEREGSLC